MKFIVNVKLVENKVNSHVGKVMDVKVISQYKTLGITLKTKTIMRPSKPMIELAGGASCIAAAVEAVALLMAELKIEDMLLAPSLYKSSEYAVVCLFVCLCG